MSTWTTRVVPWALLLAVACKPDGEATDGSGTGTEGTETSNEDTGVSATGADTTTGGEEGPEQARGIRISLVEANAGVAIPIGADGEWVDGDGRNGQVLKNRDTLIRIRVDVDEAVWVPREIEAQLHLHNPDGTTETLTAVEMITGDSGAAEDALDSTFMIGVPAEMMVHLLQYEVELYEAAVSGWEGLPEPSGTEWRLPSSGPNFVGVESTEQNMRVVMVPIAYDGPGCTATFDASPEVMAAYEDEMFQNNPLESIEMEVHEPYTVDDLDLADAQDFFVLAERIQQLRAEEQPDPNVYYYGIFDNCAQCVSFMGLGGCILGVAAGLPDADMGSASERSAIGASQLMDPNSGEVLEIGVSTFVHEVGHSQGRQHVACPGVTAGGPDPSYPHDAGLIGVWGFGVLDEQIRTSADHTDYMSYCSPTWVSDWQWRATYARILELSSWDAASMRELDEHGVLVGSIDTQTGTASWWTDRGYLTAPTDDHALRLRGTDGIIEQVPVQLSPWSEGSRVTVRAPMTSGLDEASVLELVGPEGVIRTPRSAVREYFRPASLRTE